MFLLAQQEINIPDRQAAIGTSSKENRIAVLRDSIKRSAQENKDRYSDSYSAPFAPNACSEDLRECGSKNSEAQEIPPEFHLAEGRVRTSVRLPA